MSLWSPDRKVETAAPDFKEASKGPAGAEHECRCRTPAGFVRNFVIRPRREAVLLACEPGGEMVPGRAVADDGLNGQKQKTEDRERRRKWMNAPCAAVIPGDR
jgi:hypothetical protein